MNRNPIKKIKNKITHKNKLKKWQVVLLSVLGSLFIILGVFALSLYFFQPTAEITDSPFHSDTGEQVDLGDAPQISDTGPVKRTEGFYNFLVVGKEKIGLNTDSIMVVSFHTKKNKVCISQIPRDSYVQIGGAGGRRINSVFARGYSAARTELNSLKRKAADSDKATLAALCGDAAIDIDADTLKKYIEGKVSADEICSKNGMYLLRDVIRDTLGVIIDYNVFIDLEGFRNIVDIIGGVEMVVPEDMDYTDPEQGLYIHLKAGKQTLTGDKAEQFVRFRDGYANADLGRIDAQKLFLGAFLKKIMSVSSLSKIPQLLEEFEKHVVTDITIPDAVYFGKAALSLDLSAIEMTTWPGIPRYYNGVSYYSLSKKDSLELVNQSFNVFDTDIPAGALAIAEVPKSSAPASPAPPLTHEPASEIHEEDLIDMLEPDGAPDGEFEGSPDKEPDEDDKEPDGVPGFAGASEPEESDADGGYDMPQITAELPRDQTGAAQGDPVSA